MGSRHGLLKNRLGKRASVCRSSSTSLSLYVSRRPCGDGSHCSWSCGPSVGALKRLLGVRRSAVRVPRKGLPLPARVPPLDRTPKSRGGIWRGDRLGSTPRLVERRPRPPTAKPEELEKWRGSTDADARRCRPPSWKRDTRAVGQAPTPQVEAELREVLELALGWRVVDRYLRVVDEASEASQWLR